MKRIAHVHLVLVFLFAVSGLFAEPSNDSDYSLSCPRAVLVEQKVFPRLYGVFEKAGAKTPVEATFLVNEGERYVFSTFKGKGSVQIVGVRRLRSCPKGMELLVVKALPEDVLELAADEAVLCVGTKPGFTLRYFQSLSGLNQGSSSKVGPFDPERFFAKVPTTDHMVSLEIEIENTYVQLSYVESLIKVFLDWANQYCLPNEKAEHWGYLSYVTKDGLRLHFNISRRALIKIPEALKLKLIAPEFNQAVYVSKDRLIRRYQSRQIP